MTRTKQMTAKTLATAVLVGLMPVLAAAPPATAAQRTVDFIVTADDSDPFLDFAPFSFAQGTGSVTFDDDLIVFGDEELSPDDGLQISFTIFGQTFDETDDAFFGDPGFPFPLLQFDNFEIVGLTYGVAEDGFLVSTAIDQPGVLGFDLFGLEDRGDGVLVGDLFLDVDPDAVGAAVPLPATLPLALGAFGLIGLMARRRSKAEANGAGG